MAFHEVDEIDRSSCADVQYRGWGGIPNKGRVLCLYIFIKLSILLFTCLLRSFPISHSAATPNKISRLGCKYLSCPFIEWDLNRKFHSAALWVVRIYQTKTTSPCRSTIFTRYTRLLHPIQCSSPVAKFYRSRPLIHVEERDQVVECALRPAWLYNTSLGHLFRPSYDIQLYCLISPGYVFLPTTFKASSFIDASCILILPQAVSGQNPSLPIFLVCVECGSLPSYARLRPKNHASAEFGPHRSLRSRTAL